MTNDAKYSLNYSVIHPRDPVPDFNLREETKPEERQLRIPVCLQLSMDGECSLQTRIIARRNKAGSVAKVGGGGAQVRLNPLLAMQKNASAALPQVSPEDYMSKYYSS